MYYVFINTIIIILKLYQLVPSGFPFDLKLNMLATATGAPVRRGSTLRAP